MKDTCHVLGLGSSIKAFRPDGSVTIGCNDIYRYYETDILMVISTLPYARAQFVENARPRMLLSHMPRWYHHPSYERLPNMTQWRQDRKQNLDHGIFSSNNTPFVAASYAYSMGFKEIVLWGVDFADHPLIVDEALERTKTDFRQLYEAMQEKGVGLYLGSSGSVLNLPMRR